LPRDGREGTLLDDGGLVVRQAMASDMEAIGLISGLTWEGHDYLHLVARDWMAEGGFFVGELEGRVIGTGRISPMPGGVLWLEGLRVHRDWQGRGHGRAMADWLVGEGRKRISDGTADALEFCTYVFNDRSISTSRSQGFRLVDRFWVLYREGAPPEDGPGTAAVREPSMSDYEGYGTHVPCGWKPPRNVPGSLRWMTDRCRFYEAGDGTPFHECGEGTFSPGSGIPPGGAPFFDAVDTLIHARGGSDCEIVVGADRGDLVGTAFERGFAFWDETSDPNMLVFRLDQA
jgi:GNAT superfamily N-acetyltransferase